MKKKENETRVVSVFIDLENSGGITFIEGNAFGSGTSHNVRFMIERLEPSLLEKGYTIGIVRCFASYVRKPVVPRGRQTELRKLFESYGWKMTWSESIADTALINSASEQLKSGTLSNTVLLITNDGDFTDLAASIKESGRTVLVSGVNVSKRLQEVADETFLYWEFLGGHPTKNLEGMENAVRKSPPLLNPLSFPEAEKGGDK